MQYLNSERNYSGTSPYGHLTSKKTSPLQSLWLSPKLYSTLQITPCNKVTSPVRSLLPSPVGDLNSEVPLYLNCKLAHNTWMWWHDFSVCALQTALPLSAVLFRGGKHIQPQCPPRLDVQLLNPVCWSRVPMSSVKVHTLKLSEIRGWSMLSEQPSTCTMHSAILLSRMVFRLLADAYFWRV